MNIDEEADQVVDKWLARLGAKSIYHTPKDRLKHEIRDALHRCAEAMREECAKVASDWHKQDRTNVHNYVDMAELIAQAIRHLNMEGK